MCEICKTDFKKYASFSVHCNRKHKIKYSDLKAKYFPKEELSFKCSRCENSYSSYDSLRKHVSIFHKINSHEFYVEYKLNGIWPTCLCGCGNKTEWSGKLKKFCDYAYGHYCRVHNNWGHNPSAVLHSAETRRKQYASGERKVWCDGLTKETSKILAEMGENNRKENNPERAKKISNTQKQQFIDGIRDNHGKNNPMYGKKQSIETIKKIFSYRKMNKLESNVANILTENGIRYYFQFFITDNSVCKSYDFKIKNRPILIEVDGDYWHGGPGTNSYYKKVDEIRENDKIKNKIATQNGYKLFRFWESDIKKNPEILMETLYNI